jgi:signal transduction histidine kinase
MNSSAKLSLQSQSETKPLLAHETGFDDLTHLAAELCGVPIAFIALKDKKVIRLRAKFGTNAIEVEPVCTFCSLTSQGTSAVVIPDTFLDLRIADHSWVTGNTPIRFYAGVPLISREGILIGTLSIMDLVPRKLERDQQALLQVLAGQIMVLLERNRLLEERDSLQETLKDSSKLASFGRLASSIVHEINNPLSILHARAALLSNLAKQCKITSEKAEEFAEKMLDTTRRMSKIINAFGTAMGNGEQEPAQNIALQSLIEDTLSFVLGRFNNGQVQFKYEPPKEPIYLTCKAIQISQVLVNLLNNAYDAVCDQKSRQKWVKLEIIDADDYVEIKVRDGGCIASKEHLQNVFTPFFTTKHLGKGTGLGLAISKDIVKAHGGELTVDTAPKSTTFIVKLPKKCMIHFQNE